MNARGGPGIVVASVTFGAGVINGQFFVALVLLSILTSQLAGAWLIRVLSMDPTFASSDRPHVPAEALVGQPSPPSEPPSATAVIPPGTRSTPH